jgi:hypothetical protein
LISIKQVDLDQFLRAIRRTFAAQICVQTPKACYSANMLAVDARMMIATG